jgi:glycosyltransferase involved in cell wall biosynthesis
MLQRPYGRFFNLPCELAARGHSVQLLLIDYKSGADETAVRNAVQIESVGLRRNPAVVWQRIQRITQDFAPDWVIGLSDIWYGILAARIARRCEAHYAVDSYDNYESYMPWAIPAHMLWRSAITGADLVTAAGQPLLDYMTRTGCRGVTAVVPMAADGIFFPRDRSECRRALGLPQDGPLIGYTGSLHASRDTHLLLAVMNDFALRMPAARFVLSGRRLQALELPSNATHLGYLPDDQVPLLLNAMDVMLSLNLPTLFGEHSYPVKIYEAAACEIPFVATSTRATRWMTRASNAILCTAGNIDEVTRAVQAALSRKAAHDFRPARWSTIAADFERALRQASGRA